MRVGAVPNPTMAMIEVGRVEGGAAVSVRADLRVSRMGSTHGDTILDLKP